MPPGGHAFDRRGDAVAYAALATGRSSAWSERRVWGAEVPGSNPGAPINPSVGAARAAPPRPPRGRGYVPTSSVPARLQSEPNTFRPTASVPVTFPPDGVPIATVTGTIPGDVKRPVSLSSA
jgi:hypothetical protein